MAEASRVRSPASSRNRGCRTGPLRTNALSPTPATNNNNLLLRPVVINEIHYNPITGDNDDEFIELHNRGASPVNMGGWRLSDGIDFSFPSNTVIAANGYVVVANDRGRFLATYTSVPQTIVFGNYGGSLGNYHLAGQRSGA